MASLNLTIGALEIGVFISTFLFGVITVQAHIYFRRFPNDGLVIKTLVRLPSCFLCILTHKNAIQVGTVWYAGEVSCFIRSHNHARVVRLLELGHNICVSHGLFTMTLSQYASPSPGSDRALDPSFSIAVLFSGCIAACVQVKSNGIWGFCTTELFIRLTSRTASGYYPEVTTWLLSSGSFRPCV